MEPEFASEFVRLHKIVGNAVMEGCHIVFGIGSSQLFLAALYALSPPDAPRSISVVSVTCACGTQVCMLDRSWWIRTGVVIAYVAVGARVGL